MQKKHGKKTTVSASSRIKENITKAARLSSVFKRREIRSTATSSPEMKKCITKTEAPSSRVPERKNVTLDTVDSVTGSFKNKVELRLPLQTFFKQRRHYHSQTS